MRLLECYIENFGKLSSKKYSFKEGLNCIKEDNGSGKTTLAAFIKVMLYGMSDTKRASLDENDRKHYLPWGGGICGGWLTFSSGGKSYRIERTFAPKAADDSFSLYDLATGRISEDFSSSIGTDLFGIDADGFERTVFLSERALTPKSDNKSISAKLSDLVGCDGDIGGMDEALELLEKKRKFYYKKGGSGELSDIKSKIAEINRRLDALTETENALKLEEEKLRENQAEFVKVKSNIDALHKQKEQATIRKADIGRKAERYNNLKELLTKKIAARNAILERFGDKIPTHAEIDTAAANLSGAKALREAQNQVNSVYDSIFHVTFADDFKKLLASYIEYNRKYYDPNLIRFKELFAERIPSKDEIEEVGDTLEKSYKKPLAGYIVGVITLLVGIALGLLLNPLCFGIGVIGLAAIIFFAISFHKTKRAALKQAEKFFLSVSGKVANKDDIFMLLNEMYDTLSSDLIERIEKEERKNALKEEVYNKMLSIISMHPRTNELDAEEVLQKIIEKEYSIIHRDVDHFYYESDIQQNESLAQDYEYRATSFLDRYKLSGDNAVSDLRNMLREYESANAMISDLQKEIEMYKASDLYDSEAEGERISIEVIEAQIRSADQRANELNRECTVSERNCARYTDELDKRDELIMRREELTELLGQQEDNYNVILLTKKYLSAARDNMTAKYLGKTKESFLKYTKAIGGSDNDAFVMDTDFGISRLEGASARPTEAYSRGTRDLYNLATRLALVDSLYEGEDPFIILDDPFTALDDKKVKEATKLLHEFSKKKQIIYFTCSDSRST